MQVGWIYMGLSWKDGGAQVAVRFVLATITSNAPQKTCMFLFS